jgi:hypothetical protein
MNLSNDLWHTSGKLKELYHVTVRFQGKRFHSQQNNNRQFEKSEITSDNPERFIFLRATQTLPAEYLRLRG